MSTTDALARNTALQIVGKLVSNILGFATFFLLARFLGAEGYGKLSIILTFLSVFAIIVDFGLTLTTTQIISEQGADEKKLIGNLLTLRFISAFLFLGSAPFIALLFPYDTAIIIAIAIGTISYFFATSAQMLVGVFQKRLLIGRAMLAEILNRGWVLAGTALVPILDLSLLHVVLILTIGNAIQFFSILSSTRKYVPFRLQVDFQVWKMIIARSWPIGASIFFNLIYLKGDIIFLSFYRSDAEIGNYSAAYKVIDVITVIPVMFMGLILPMLVAAWSEEKRTKHNAILQQAFDFFSLIAIPFAVGSIMTGVDLMEFMSGTEFTEGGRILAVLGPAASIVFFGSLFGHAVVGIQKQKQMVFGYFIVAVLTVIGYLMFIPEYGIWAAAWMTLASELIITLITAITVIVISGFRPKFKQTTFALLGSTAMGAALYLSSELHVLAQIGIGITVYAFLLFLFGSLKPRFIRSLFLPERLPISQA